MSIESYFQSLLDAIANVANVASTDVALDKRGPQVGLIRGDVYFIDGSRLYFRELVDLENDPARLMYSYHYQRADALLVFRYDDTPHYPELPHFPNHKHVDSEQNVIPASAPDLAAVLNEIDRWRSNLNE